MSLKEKLFFKDKNSAIGSIRFSSAFFGGLISSYIFICIIGNFLSYSIFENIVITLIILPFIWISLALWIILSHNKITAIYKTLFLLILSSSILFILGTI
jgi:hypothetical protein